MKNYIRRFIPVDSLDIAAMESWLADMAEDGLFLVSFGTYFAHFESRPPQKAAYRLEPASSLYLTPDEKKLEILDEFGWEYVASVDKYFHVFRAKTEDAPEIHTDPAVQAEAYEKLYRSQRNWGIPYVIFLAFFLYLLIFTEKAGFFNAALLGLSHTLQWLYIVVVAVLGVCHFLRLRKIKDLLKNGTPLSHSADYRRKRPLRLTACVFILLLFSASFLSYTVGMIVRWDADWRELSEPIPMVSLAEIEQDPAFQNGHIDDANTTYVSGDVDNEIRFRRSFLAPEQTTITQSGFVPGRNWAGSSDPYEPTLAFHIYRLRCPSMGGRFVESQMDWELSDLMPWDTIYLSAETGLDEAYLCVSGKYSDALKKLFLRHGDTIIYVSYFGEADLRPFVPQFAALMQETYPTRKPQ